MKLRKKTNKATQTNAGPRPRGFSVKASLMLVLVLFMGLLLVVGGMAVVFLQQSFKSLEELEYVNGRASEANSINASLQNARIALLASARERQENDARAAETFVNNAKASVDQAKKTFAQFQANPLQDEVGRPLYMNVLRAYRSYIDDGVDTMVDALASGDYASFYMINTEYGQPRGDAFVAAIGRFVAYIDQYRTDLQTTAAGNRDLAIAAVGGAILLGLLLTIFARMFLGRRVLNPLKQVGAQFDRIAAGDLTSRVEVKNQNEIGQLMLALQRMQQGLGRTVLTVRQGVEEINFGSREIAAGNSDLSSRTEEQAASLEETAASMEQLAATVKQNADNARQANKLAASASGTAVQGGEVVGQVVETMASIAGSSRKVTEIISVIDGIAFQTNILALNAAVEAARAGEQGKGFAVVAGEVRSLAQRSAQAAKEIKELIQTSVTEVDRGSELVARAGATMQEVVNAVQRVTDIMGEISAASDEQSSGIEQVNRAVTQMDEVTQQNAALVEQAAAGAASLEEQAGRLQAAVAAFKVNESEVIDVAAQQSLRGAASSRSDTGPGGLPGGLTPALAG
ncbi:Tar ligand binding domain-containing protein [Achromobacter sp. GG226]|uniref:methyl-accepting chemotaxis protein n=1 Tax=Verticiella alkaliphila TaxID=2779529 RepID=UPI001C0B62C9|nr:methyl-accepting chemotaxis protein [Verticiella sp. GG226]MBU4610520.1 Tar ligand binding domain-containing protein [Verticiella sp. GG226]